MPQLSTASVPSLRAVTLDLDPGRFRFSLWRNITITVWHDQIKEADAKRVIHVSRRLNEEFPQGRSQVLFVPAGVLPPEGAAAEILTELYNPNASRIKCFASMLEGSGFWASAVRSRMTNMRMAGGNMLTMRTFDTIDQVAEWLPSEHVQRTGVHVSAGELSAVLIAEHAQGTRDDSPERPGSF